MRSKLTKFFFIALNICCAIIIYAIKYGYLLLYYRSTKNNKISTKRKLIREKQTLKKKIKLFYTNVEKTNIFFDTEFIKIDEKIEEVKQIENLLNLEKEKLKNISKKNNSLVSKIKYRDEKIEKIVEQKRVDENNLNHEISSLIKEKSEQQSTIQKLEKKLKEVTERKNKDIKQLKKELFTSFDFNKSMSEKSDNSLNELKEKHTKERKKLILSHKKEITKINDENHKKLNIEKENIILEINELKRKNKAELENHKKNLSEENEVEIQNKLVSLAENYILNELPFDISITNTVYHKDKFILDRKEEKLNRDKEAFEREKQFFLLEKEKQNINNKKVEFLTEVQKMEFQNKEILNKVEKKELELKLNHQKQLYELDTTQLKNLIELVNDRFKNQNLLHNTEKERIKIEVDTKKIEILATKRDLQDTKALNLIEKERLKLACDEQRFNIIQIQAQYDSRVQFFEQKFEVLKLIQNNKNILNQQELESLKNINQQEKILSQQILTKEQTKQLVYNAKSEKEITNIIYSHTDNIRRITKQMTDLQNDKDYYMRKVQNNEQNKQKLEYLEKMGKAYLKAKESALEVKKETLNQKLSFIEADYNQQYSYIKDSVYTNLNSQIGY